MNKLSLILTIFGFIYIVGLITRIFGQLIALSIAVIIILLLINNKK
jgi:hypothetical protein